MRKQFPPPLEAEDEEHTRTESRQVPNSLITIYTSNYSAGGLWKLGSWQFGTVYKAIDVDSGKFMAVKILERPTRASKQEDWRQLLYYALKREVETLSEISHVSKSSSTSYTHETDICASHTSSII
jgi:hypothetical protein